MTGKWVSESLCSGAPGGLCVSLRAEEISGCVGTWLWEDPGVPLPPAVCVWGISDPVGLPGQRVCSASVCERVNAQGCECVFTHTAVLVCARVCLLLPRCVCMCLSTHTLSVYVCEHGSLLPLCADAQLCLVMSG